MSQEIQPPRTISAPRTISESIPTTHRRIYIPTLEKLRKVAERWNTTQQDAERYLVDLAYAGLITPEGPEPK